MVTVRIRASRAGVKRLLHELPAVLAGKGGDPSGVARSLSLRLGMTALSLVKQAFVEKAAGKADESGLQWQPLKPTTVAGRRKGGGKGTVQILRDTGILMNSLSPGGANNLLEARPGLASVGTSVPHAVHHHSGTPTIPARPLWPAPQDWPQRWLQALAKQLAEGAAQAAVTMARGAGK